ncbi:MAG: peptide/nickel transport system ATP-binding protein [Ilumatobacteraceae bacterium]
MLEVRDLRVTIGRHQIVHIDALDIPAGGRLGLVGESGSGKTMTAMSIVGLLPDEARVTGSITFNGRELLGRSDIEMSRVRGADIGVVFQDPSRALNPMMRIGKQISEAVRLHMKLSRAETRERVIGLLRQVQLPGAEALLRRYPHQLSGGQQQRVLIAIAIACDPKLLNADEPTTALDVTVQAEILRLLVHLSEERSMGLLFVSHDLGVVRFVCDHVAEVYGGSLVEVGPTDDVVERSQHRYTSALLAANPGIPASDEIEQYVGRRLTVIRGSVPALGHFPAGCRFRNRCDAATDSCVEGPPVTTLEGEHSYRCWNPVGRSVDVGAR